MHTIAQRRVRSDVVQYVHLGTFVSMRARSGSGQIRSLGQDRFLVRISAGVDAATGKRLQPSRVVRGTRQDAERVRAELLLAGCASSRVAPIIDDYNTPWNMPIAFAAAAAFCFAAGAVFVKRGMDGNSLVTALLISLSVTAFVTAVFAAFDMPQELSLLGVALFAASGVTGDGIGRAAFFGAVDRLGPSISTPIQTATYPAVALIGGVLLFSETLTVVRVLGAAAIVAGIWALTGQNPAGGNGSPRTGAGFGWHWAYLLPVAAGVAFGISDFLRKVGLDETPNPAFGATVAAATVLAIWGAIALSVPRVRSQVKLGPGWQWFIGTGVFVGFGVVSVFAALDEGDVTLVGPIIAAQPIAVVGLSALLLREIEPLTWRHVAGATLAVVGVISIALGG